MRNNRRMTSVRVVWPLSVIATATVLAILLLAWLGFPLNHFTTDIIGDISTLEYDHNESAYNFWVLYQAFDNLLERPLDPGYSTLFYGDARSFAVATGHYGIALVMLPVYLLSGKHLILTYNLYLLLTFPLSALAVYLLARHVADASPPVAMLVGLAAAFASFRVVHIRTLDNLSTHWYWLALYVFHRLLDQPRWSRAAALGLLTALTMLSSGYYGIFLLVTLALVGGYALLRQRIATAHLLPITLAGGLAALASLPFMLYRFRNPTFAAGQPYQHLVALSASPADWLRGASWLWGGYYPSPGDWEGRLLIGIVPLVLAGVAGWLYWTGRFSQQVQPGRALSRWQVAELYLIILLAGYLLSLGPQLAITDDFALPLPYRLIRLLPGFKALRVVERFVFLALTAAWLLAAMALAHWQEYLKQTRRFQWIVMAATLLIGIEQFPANLPQDDPESVRLLAPSGRDFDTEWVRWLAGLPPGAPVMHYPIGWPYDWVYPAYTPWHEQPSLNGIGALTPGWYPLAPARTHPSMAHLVEMWQRGITYVLVHQDYLDTDYDAETRAAFRAGFDDLAAMWGAFEPVGWMGTVEVYRIQIVPQREVFYDFDSAAISIPSLGWSLPDQDVRGITFAWTTGPDARLDLFLDPAEGAEIRLGVIGATTPALRASLHIEANGQPVTLAQEADAKGMVIFRGRIPRAVLLTSPGLLHLRFLTDESFYNSPAGAQVYGLAFDWLTISATP